MRNQLRLAAVAISIVGGAFFCNCSSLRRSAPAVGAPPNHLVAPEPGENHFANIRQLTFGGENAEAYFSADGKRLIFQSTREGYPCDQIFEMNIDGTGVRELSTGKGRTTCSYFFPNGK